MAQAGNFLSARSQKPQQPSAQGRQAASYNHDRHNADSLLSLGPSRYSRASQFSLVFITTKTIRRFL